MSQNFFWTGAEAELKETIFSGEKALSKKRLPKNYRDKKLDEEIRKIRTRSEVKLIKNASMVVRVPRIFSVDEKEAEIIMELVEGKMLKELIEKNNKLCIEAGKEIRKLHDLGVVHGDLTTSNMIVEGNGKLCFVDFGLGFFSKRTEDKATDLIVFKKTFNATHSSIKNGWELVMKGYNPDQDMVDKMDAIEKRGRYH